jgi:hypothetical protein
MVTEILPSDFILIAPMMITLEVFLEGILEDFLVVEK